MVQDSPAEKARIAAGDIITAFDSKQGDTPQDLQKVVALTAPGKGVPVTVWRDKTHKTMEIKIGDTPDDTSALKSNTRGKSITGLELRPITPDVARQLNLRSGEGVVVVRVEEDGAAAEAGLQRGDVVREVNRQRVRSMAAALRSGNKGAPRWPPIPANARTAAAKPWRSSVLRQALGRDQAFIETLTLTLRIRWPADGTATRSP